MNVLPADRPIDPALWEHPRMRVALARRDISEVYRLLGRTGVSQRQIAALTGQSQSEICDIVQGRQVQAYDLLVRIADGLSIPRGYMGLAFSDAATQRLATPSASKEDFMERRTFLGIVSKIVMGAALSPTERDLLAVAPFHTPVPARVSWTEVTQLRALTKALRAYDAAHGGGSCRDVILAHTHWAGALLNASCPDEVRPALLSAVAEIKTLAGWTAHDLGLTGEARRYLTQAVKDTQEAGNPAHSAIVLYHLGRIPLDNGDGREALKLFQLGQISAQDADCTAAVALLHANEALAYAQLGDARQALAALRRAEDEYAHTTNDDEGPEFLKFFDHGALRTSAARVHSRLGLTDHTHRQEAITRLLTAVEEVPAERVRQRAFNLGWLATCVLADGDLTAGADIGHQALAAAREVNSTRLLDALAPLQAQAESHQRDSDLNQLAHDIRRLRFTV
ncbi:hypothetical protein LX15_000909 [Streptoalloteichus tenebrarius]|uniref:HTH cro/C1-type domain-containing protein n=1 Tax=Streptoalloteichus tenebrarius (strain ATCC 17920 / DSM 40477 / JCM 4838 / CBS 697.72 / NBRC 16177 / NCIMB 11028 / NRRL B-12390 / A12253. 1 / ISP 5477) TaxID=1933 RepID=A0ABT1HNX9_STRSD|nr:transcriptional regulator [Streptoalloteichus tenebrarius]MCP2257224.1 hypothetical protein [Streptoalloteichus tenebrarius]BFE98862.1 helix-turn-helix transcriptional regulator [Streptoalloteichus tenebrarius]